MVKERKTSKVGTAEQRG